MAKFLTSLEMTPLGDGKNFKLDESLIYSSDLVKERVIAPKGFITDGASIPWIFRPIFPVWGRWGKAAVLHDWLYRETDYPKRLCDSMFDEAMKVLHVHEDKRNVIYKAVKYFGFLSFWQDRRKRNRK